MCCLTATPIYCLDAPGSVLCALRLTTWTMGSLSSLSEIRMVGEKPKSFLFTIECIDTPRNAIVDRKAHFCEDTPWHDVDLGAAVQGRRNKELSIDKTHGGRTPVACRSRVLTDCQNW